MRYRLALSIRYDFDRLTGAARQLLRICPANLPGRQSVGFLRLLVDPAPVERREFHDFFGTQVIELALPAGLAELHFDMTTEVRVTGDWEEFDLSVPLSGLSDDLLQVTDLGPSSPHHFLKASPRIPDVDEIARFAATIAARSATTRGAVRALGEALHGHLQYDPEATNVDTPVAEAFAGRRGVCQDFAQIMIAGLRSLGIPAAYVSGFLRTTPPPGQARLVGADAMHGWMIAWTGLRGGWVGYDPTNACFISENYVVIGHGRDYGDAAPVVGMLRLEGAQSGSHTVDVEVL